MEWIRKRLEAALADTEELEKWAKEGQVTGGGGVMTTGSYLRGRLDALKFALELLNVHTMEDK